MLLNIAIADCPRRRKKRGHLFLALFRRYQLVLSENRTGTEYDKKTINLTPVITQSSSLSLISITSFDSSPITEASFLRKSIN